MRVETAMMRTPDGHSLETTDEPVDILGIGAADVAPGPGDDFVEQLLGARE